MIFRFLLVCFIMSFIHTNAQENFLAVTIPNALKENANAVIRLEDVHITISSRKSMNIKKKRVVTVFNEYGLRYLQAYETFNKSTSVKSIEAIVYDAYGKEIKKIKRKDFRESAMSEGSLITDDQIISYEYTPITYPFTFVYASEVQSSNTAFIPSFSPVEGNYASVEKTSMKIDYQPDLGFRYKEYNFEGYKLNKQEGTNSISFTSENIPGIKSEDHLPPIHKIAPRVMFALDRFNLEGVDGEVTDWKSFGTWTYNKLLAGTDELPETTIAAIKAKVGNETDPIKKAKIVYGYVQGKTRYISIQLGIGGWKPMLAKDVDRLGYGDCKALTNYTRALLKAVGVESFYTVIYGDSNRRDMMPEFASMQGNHVILAIPHNNNYVWLECTSQTAPFGFQGDFTDNRMAVVVKPEGGEIVRTTVYETKNNSQLIEGSYTITEAGGLTGGLVIKSKGTQYDNKYFLEMRSADDLDKFYKKGFHYINGLRLKKVNLVNNRENTEFIEELTLETENYCNKSGNRLIFPVNAFNQLTSIPQRYRNRMTPFEIQRGFIDTDEVVISLPEGYSIEAQPESISISEKFGEYKAEYQLLEGNKMLYKRTWQLNEGFYASNEYENYRLFMEKIAKNDNAKLVLVKNKL